MARRKKLKIIESKLGRERAWGVYWQGQNLIEIDYRQKAKRYCNTALHEMLHHFFPNASEFKVTRTSSQMATELWKLGFRKIEK